MNLIQKFKFLFACVFIGLLVHACTKDKTPAPPKPCDPNTVYFQNDILPFINSTCGRTNCHDEISQVEGLVLKSYEGVMKIVKPNNPGDSELMEVIIETDEGKRMPLGDSALTNEQINLISKWILQGAKNTVCTQSSVKCDSGTVTYSGVISKIMSNNCIGCHKPGNLGGGFDLSSHAGVKDCAATGKLYNAVAQNGQAQAMPKGGTKLSNCNISAIKSWIDAGTPNN